MKEQTPIWITCGWLALAGTLGTLSRYAISGAAQWLWGAAFPWGTLVVNASGCLFFGVVWSMAAERMIITGETRFLILTGFMGAYTTFSTYAFETAAMLQRAQWLAAAANFLGQNVLGILCVMIGLTLGRLL